MKKKSLESHIPKKNTAEKFTFQSMEAKVFPVWVQAVLFVLEWKTISCFKEHSIFFSK